MGTLKDIIFYRLLNVVLFYLGWVYIVMSAAKGTPFRGIIGGVVLILFHLFISKKWIKETLFIVTIALVGFGIDTIYAFSKLVIYSSPNTISTSLAPIWISVLYALFGTTINYSLSWLKYQVILSMIFGAFGGAICYFVSAKLGAASFPNQTVALSIIAVVWLILMPIACWYSNFLDRTFGKS